MSFCDNSRRRITCVFLHLQNHQEMFGLILRFLNNQPGSLLEPSCHKIQGFRLKSLYQY